MLRENRFSNCPVSVLKHCNAHNYIHRRIFFRRGQTQRWRLFDVNFAAVIFGTLNRYCYVKRLLTNSAEFMKKFVVQVTSL